MLVPDPLLGATRPLLAICLEPGESAIGPTAELAWMTNSIQLTIDRPGMSTYTATTAAGTIAFAPSQASPGPPALARTTSHRERANGAAASSGAGRCRQCVG